MCSKQINLTIFEHRCSTERESEEGKKIYSNNMSSVPMQNEKAKSRESEILIKQVINRKSGYTSMPLPKHPGRSRCPLDFLRHPNNSDYGCFHSGSSCSSWC